MAKEKKERVKKPIFKRVWFWLLVICFLSALFGDGNSSNQNQEQEQTQTNSQTQMEEATPEQIELDKETAKAKDLELYSTVLSAETKYKGMISVMDTGSTLDIYDTCKDTKRFAQNCFSRAADQEDSMSEDYVKACQGYFVQLKSIADYLMDFVDNEKMEDLSKAKEGIEALNSHILNITTQRIDYLTSAGFTSEEITEILESW